MLARCVRAGVVNASAPFRLSRRACTSSASPAAALNGDSLGSNATTKGDTLANVQAKLGQLDGGAENVVASIKADIDIVSTHLLTVVQNQDSEVIDMAAGYLLQNKGKLLRPSLVALAGYAAMPGDEDKCRELHSMSMEEMMASADKNLDDLESNPFCKHLRLAEVTELVHTASLIHDDCLDSAEKRRDLPALHTVVGVKVAILAGDYLLARASKYLSSLEDTRVVKNMSQALEDLPVGEIMQMEGSTDLESYYVKSFCKTSSLIAHSCKGSAILSDPTNTDVHDALFNYGRHLGLAFQIVDDCLDFTGEEEELGKPANNDIRCGVYTLPVCSRVLTMLMS